MLLLCIRCGFFMSACISLRCSTPPPPPHFLSSIHWACTIRYTLCLFPCFPIYFHVSHVLRLFVVSSSLVELLVCTTAKGRAGRGRERERGGWRRRDGTLLELFGLYSLCVFTRNHRRRHIVLMFFGAYVYACIWTWLNILQLACRCMCVIVM